MSIRDFMTDVVMRIWKYSNGQALVIRLMLPTHLEEFSVNTLTNSRQFQKLVKISFMYVINVIAQSMKKLQAMLQNVQFVVARNCAKKKRSKSVIFSVSVLNFQNH